VFTGLIEEKGRIVQSSKTPGGLKLVIEAPSVSTDVNVGDSVAVNGVCLTAVSVSPPMLSFDVVRETAERSTLGRLAPGSKVNLERALRATDRLGGHIVLGHVDGVGSIREIRHAGSEAVFCFEADPQIMQYIVGKGSVAVDGISLTVVDVGSNWFTVAVIPHTLASTTLGEASVGSKVNLETDIIAKYVFKCVQKFSSNPDQRLLEKLAQGGFL
jgi:riboflavin synthase